MITILPEKIKVYQKIKWLSSNVKMKLIIFIYINIL